MNYLLTPQLPPNCTQTNEIYENQLLRLVQFVQISICVVTIYTFFYIYITKRNIKLVPIHRNLKAIYFFAAVICTLQATSVVFVQLMHELRRHFTSNDPCEKQWVAWNCLIVRSPTFISMPAYTLIHVGVIIERLFATLNVRRYEHTSARLSAILISLIGIATLANAFYMLKNVDWNQRHDYCSLSSIPTLGPLSKVIFVLACANLPILVVELTLFMINGRQMQRAKQNPILVYQLSTIYQLRENVISLNITRPFAVCHFFTESLYLSFNTIVRTYVPQSQIEFLIFAETTYTLMCIYNFLAIYVPFHYRKKHTQYIIPTTHAVETTITHFKSLNEHFNRHYSMRKQRSMSNVI